MPRVPKKQSWWLQNVGTKNGPACPLCHKPAGCKCKHKEWTLCDDCGKKNCKGNCKKAKKNINTVPATPPRGSKPVHAGAPSRNSAPGLCGCGAYLYANGKCRDMSCSNH